MKSVETSDFVEITNASRSHPKTPMSSPSNVVKSADLRIRSFVGLRNFAVYVYRCDCEE